MMTTTVARLFDNRADALDALREIEDLGVPKDEISLVASNAEGWYDENRRPGEARTTRDEDHDNNAGEGAGAGAVTGGVIGGGAGLLAGLGLLAIPGLGPVVAAGWLASTAAGLAGGALAGGAIGGLVGALTESGVEEEEAHVYSEGVRRGGTLLVARVDESRASEVDAIMRRHHGVEAKERGRAYREEGWTRYDPNAPAYTRDEVARERARYPTTGARAQPPL